MTNAVPLPQGSQKCVELSASKPVERSSAFLHPGHMFVSDEPTSVTTILGSCVAVCLWDTARRIGGINHYLLAHRVGQKRRSLQFGSVAIARLINALEQLGSNQGNLEAKIFGGACVIGNPRNDTLHLGAKNVEVARKLLKTENIRIVVEDVGGKRARKLVFHTDTGTVWLKKL